MSEVAKGNFARPNFSNNERIDRLVIPAIIFITAAASGVGAYLSNTDPSSKPGPKELVEELMYSRGDAVINWVSDQQDPGQLEIDVSVRNQSNCSYTFAVLGSSDHQLHVADTSDENKEPINSINGYNQPLTNSALAKFVTEHCAAG